MAEPAYGTATRTVISERTTELVLPSPPTSDNSIPREDPERQTAVSESAATPPQSASPPPKTRAPQTGSTRASASDLIRRELGTSKAIDPRAANTPNSSGATSESSASPEPQKTHESQRGIALPGDRGPRAQATQTQRPSFWRRIALGGRKQAEVQLAPKRETAANAAAVEQRIVEPLLQALVSVEAKLERSHVDLTQRSDQIEQRLTQLWDIEEQLGTLVELQESLLHVSEQQRRLASSVESQTRTLRWLVGSILFSFAAAAFVVAAVLQ